MEKIEDELSALIVKQYEIGADCLLYDTTNFFTYIDTRTKTSFPSRVNVI